MATSGLKNIVYNSELFQEAANPSTDPVQQALTPSSIICFVLRFSVAVKRNFRVLSLTDTVSCCRTLSGEVFLSFLKLINNTSS